MLKLGRIYQRNNFKIATLFNLSIQNSMFNTLHNIIIYFKNQMQWNQTNM